MQEIENHPQIFRAIASQQLQKIQGILKLSSRGSGLRQVSVHCPSQHIQPNQIRQVLSQYIIPQSPCLHATNG